MDFEKLKRLADLVAFTREEVARSGPFCDTLSDDQVIDFLYSAVRQRCAEYESLMEKVKEWKSYR